MAASGTVLWIAKEGLQTQVAVRKRDPADVPARENLTNRTKGHRKEGLSQPSTGAVPRVAWLRDKSSVRRD